MLLLRNRGVCFVLIFLFPVRTPKLQLTAEQSSTGEMLDPTKKRYPHPRAKEKSQQDSRRDKISFRIKFHTCQRCLEGSNQTLCVPGPRDPTETEPDLCSTRWRRYGPAVACNRKRSSGYNYLAHTACCIRPLGGDHR